MTEEGNIAMLRGIATMNLWADDLAEATRWYTELLGVEPLTERGPGFVTASVVDPFGNVLGIMHNRHYLDILGRSG
jgi:catechol 2,3-dioxygenase-like lactoylglutathione lyase family enzyme